MATSKNSKQLSSPKDFGGFSSLTRGEVYVTPQGQVVGSPLTSSHFAGYGGGGSSGGGSSRTTTTTSTVSRGMTNEQRIAQQLEARKQTILGKQSKLQSDASNVSKQLDAYNKIQNALNKGSFINPQWKKDAGLSNAFVNQAILTKKRVELQGQISSLQSQERSLGTEASVYNLGLASVTADLQQPAGISKLKSAFASPVSQKELITSVQAERKETVSKPTPSKPLFTSITTTPAKTLREPSGPLESLTSMTIFSPFLGIKPAPSRGEQLQALKERKASDTEIAQFQGERIGFGLSLGATKGVGIAAKEGAGFLGNLLKPVSSKVPEVLKTGLAPRVATTTTGFGFQTAGALSSEAGISQEAKRIAKEEGISEAEAKKLIRASFEQSIGRGISGLNIQTVEEGTGKVLKTERQAPEIGREGNEFIGLGQRFVAENIPGIVPFIAPESTEAGAREAFKQRGILEPTQKQVQSLIEAQKTSGLFSTGGLFLTEAGSELVAAGIIGKGSKGLGKAQSVKEQEKELFKSIVPATVIAGFGEGLSQTYNVETLTKQKPETMNLISGGLFGGVTSGIFGVATAKFTPRGKGGLVQFVGSAIDFPGETGGDILGGFARKPFGKEVAGLRIPILTGSETTIKTPSETIIESKVKKGKPKTGLFNFGESQIKGTTNIFGIGTVPADEFGLPILSDIKSPTKIDTPGETIGLSPSTNVFGGSFANIFGDTKTTFKEDTKIDVNLFGESISNVPSTVSVPSITPSGLPFFIPAVPFGEGSGGRGRGRKGVKYINEFAIAFGEFRKGFNLTRQKSRASTKKKKRR